MSYIQAVGFNSNYKFIQNEAPEDSIEIPTQFYESFNNTNELIIENRDFEEITSKDLSYSINFDEIVKKPDGYSIHNDNSIIGLQSNCEVLQKPLQKQQNKRALQTLPDFQPHKKQMIQLQRVQQLPPQAKPPLKLPSLVQKPQIAQVLPQKEKISAWQQIEQEAWRSLPKPFVDQWKQFRLQRRQLVIAQEKEVQQFGQVSPVLKQQMEALEKEHDQKLLQLRQEFQHLLPKDHDLGMVVPSYDELVGFKTSEPTDLNRPNHPTLKQMQEEFYRKLQPLNKKDQG